MQRIQIDVNTCTESILEALRHGGLLLTSKAGDKVNSMVIGWGTIGVNWGKPVFAVYVRKGRYTRELLDQNPEFTINVPMAEIDRNIFRICGSKSGRDMDKIAEAGLTTVDGEKVSVPALAELPLTLECKVIYRQVQEYELYSEEIRRCYPQDVDSSNPMANRDEHVTYYGEIINAYILVDDDKVESTEEILRLHDALDQVKKAELLQKTDKLLTQQD